MDNKDDLSFDRQDNVLDFTAYHQDRSVEGEADRAEEEIKSAIRKLKLKRLLTILLIFLILSVFILVYYLYKKNHKYIDADVKYSRLKSEVFAGYTNLGNDLVRYGKDGVVLVDESGKEVFNAAYNMKAPIADSCGKYLVIGDLGGASASLFDKSGKLCSIHSSFPIVSVKTSGTGVFMVISEDEEKTYTNFYYKDGKALAESQHPLAKKRFPVVFELSYNGIQAAIGFLGYDRTELTSTLAVLGFDQVGETKPNNVIFSYELGEEKPVILEYNSSGQLLLVTDKGFRVFLPDSKKPEIAKINFETQPSSVLYNDKYIVCIMEEDEAKLIRFYDYNGKLIQSLDLLIDYQQLLLNDDLLLMGRENELIAYDVKGNLRLEYLADGKIKDFKSMGSRLKYLLVYEGKMEFIEFK